MTIETLNVVTGSHDRSHYFWDDRLLPSIRSRFGDVAIDHAEEHVTRVAMQPFIIYIVQRLQVRKPKSGIMPSYFEDSCTVCILCKAKIGLGCANVFKDPGRSHQEVIASLLNLFVRWGIGHKGIMGRPLNVRADDSTLV